MGNHFKRIVTTAALDELMKRSNHEPVVVFKHSTTCAVSSGVYRQMEDLSREIALIEIQSARDLSREFGVRTGIRHESPQVIVLRNSKPVWHASHWEITSKAVEQALRENA